MELKIMPPPERFYTVTANGFSMNGDNKVSIPECKIKAGSYMEAIEKLNLFLSNRLLTDDIELVTPFDLIDFD